MKQSRGTSLLKSVVSTAVGFAVAMVANVLVLPLFGFYPSLSENVQITIIYTVISVARQFGMERIFETLGWRTRMSAFAMAVLAERQRQITHEGWDAAHDDGLLNGELARAGAAYASQLSLDQPPHWWPWSAEWWKPYNFRRDLVRAAALIIAEGERFDRQRKSSRKPIPGAASEPALNRSA